MTIEHVFLAWQCPETRRILPVGRLLALGDEGYEFSYIRAVERARQAGFQALVSFPDITTVYRSEELPPVFKNRVMPTSRPDYPAFVSELGLQVGAGPMAIMGRSGGRRATDELEVFAPPTLQEDGSLEMRVLARGVRHVPGAEPAITELAAGERLFVAIDAQNPHSPYARLLRTQSVRLVGYLPDYLAHELDRLAVPSEPTVTVERINPSPTPVHHRLLCRVQLPPNCAPFRGADYSPIPHDATSIAA